jgi:hypothetical protein
MKEERMKRKINIATEEVRLFASAHNGAHAAESASESRPNPVWSDSLLDPPIDRYEQEAALSW